MKAVAVVLFVALLLPSIADAQTARPSVAGTWEARLGEDTYRVVIRSDSSAHYGDEVVRWRARGDSIYIALGGEWVAYRMRLKAKELTLSGGDLAEPITLRLVGPETKRPANVSVPPDPDPAR